MAGHTGPKKPVAIANAPVRSQAELLAEVTGRETPGAPSVTDLVKKTTPEGREEAAQVAIAISPDSTVAAEVLLTPREQRDFHQALDNWFRGEILAGRRMPDLETQRIVRLGLVGDLQDSRPGGASEFEKFLAIP